MLFCVYLYQQRERNDTYNKQQKRESWPRDR